MFEDVRRSSAHLSNRTDLSGSFLRSPLSTGPSYSYVVLTLGPRRYGFGGLTTPTESIFCINTMCTWDTPGLLKQAMMRRFLVFGSQQNLDVRGIHHQCLEGSPASFVGWSLSPTVRDVQLQASCHTHPSPSSPTPILLHPSSPLHGPPPIWQVLGKLMGTVKFAGPVAQRGGAGDAAKRVKSGTDRSCWNVLEGASPDTHGPALGLDLLGKMSRSSNSCRGVARQSNKKPLMCQAAFSPQ